MDACRGARLLSRVSSSCEGTLTQKRIMIVGAGEVALSCLPYLYPQNQIYLMNRTSAHTQDIQQKYPLIQCLPFEQRIPLLKEMDILISATASPHLIFHTNDFIDTHLIAVDLAIPRDIEKNNYIECIDLESLNQEIEFNNQQRLEDQQHISELINHEVSVIQGKLSSIENDYMIQSSKASFYK